MVGAPLPFPSLVAPSQEQIAIINFTSTLITLVGTIIGVGFYLERRNNLKLEAQNKKIDTVEEKIDEGVIATNENIKAVHQDMRDMERRICDSNDVKFHSLEKSIEERGIAAKSLEDERINNLSERIRMLERGGRNPVG